MKSQFHIGYDVRHLRVFLMQCEANISLSVSLNRQIETTCIFKNISVTEIHFFKIKFTVRSCKISLFLNMFVRSHAHLILSGMFFFVFFLPEYMMQPTATCAAAAVIAGLFFSLFLFPLRAQICFSCSQMRIVLPQRGTNSPQGLILKHSPPP